MRICFISDSKSVHCKRWTEAMAKLGHEVHLVCNHPVNLAGVNVHVREMYPFGKKGLCRIICGMLNVRKTKKLIRAINPDIVHLLGLFPLMAPDLKHIVRGLPNLAISGWGGEFTGSSGMVMDEKAKGILRYILKQADKITATGRHLAQITSQFTGKEIIIVPYGVELNRFSPSEFPEKQSNALTIGFLKHFEKKYGPECLLRAFALLTKKHGNIELLLIGGGSQANTLEQLAADLRITPLIRFIGAVPYEDVPLWLSRMDIFVMPSVYEEFGVAALEASAMELPVVASNAGGIPEVVQDGKTGILVPPENPAALADAIDKLISNPQMRAEFGKAGRRYVEENYRWEENVKAMIEVYKSMSPESC
ncbi:MAG: glycosyltransferase family 4 protein [Planctomycetes bacterium]|nr:glycosyltransferase family 4 protein [Planctomycetota bacterium]